MTYAVPHFRYGALIYSNLENCRIRRKKIEEIEKIYRVLFKRTMSIAKKTPNRIIKDMLKSWNIETLAKLSYNQAANKWMKYIEEK